MTDDYLTVFFTNYYKTRFNDGTAGRPNTDESPVDGITDYDGTL